MGETIRDKLAQHGQQLLLRVLDALPPEPRARLCDQLTALDWSYLARALASGRAPVAVDPAAISPCEAVVAAGQPDEAAARAAGERALRQGAVAVLLVAGGQGTRLGFAGPKGAFPLGAVSGLTLFEILVERVVASGERYGVTPPLFVMTSPVNHEATVDFFAARGGLGLPPEKLTIFSQGQAPAIDERGRLLRAAPDQLVLAPDGNGGLFAALRDASAFAAMEAAGVEAISYVQVDNALARPLDPLFIGYHLSRGSDFSCKAIAKTSALERVGNFALVDGRLRIVEYTEIPEALARQTDDAGQLRFAWGNPGLFLWSRAFAAAQAARDDLPIHRAHKKIPCLDDDGRPQTPARPNGYKLETFALDTLDRAERTLLFACDRDAEFAPVKNAAGADSPASARALMTAHFSRWIAAAGGSVAPGVQLEISARYALDADELAERLAGAPPHLDADTYLAP